MYTPFKLLSAFSLHSFEMQLGMEEGERKINLFYPNVLELNMLKFQKIRDTSLASLCVEAVILRDFQTLIHKY